MTRPWRVGELCAGYGGLHMGLQALGVPTRLRWVAENDPHAAKVLAGNYPDVPNVGDITRVSWRHVGAIDVLTAGYPCQPFSNIGKRGSVGDKRFIWPYIESAIRVLGPRIVLLENVAAHVDRGLRDVVGSLAGIGYDAAWVCATASEVGAPHLRNRVFVVAARSGRGPARADRIPETTLPQVLNPVGALLPTPVAWEGKRSSATARTTNGNEQLSAVVLGLPASPYYVAPEVTDGLPLDLKASVAPWGQYGPAVHRWEAIVGRPVPSPAVLGRRGGVRMSAQFVEWMMGLPAGWVSRWLPNGKAVGVVGNGVVPLQAALVFGALMRTMGVLR